MVDFIGWADGILGWLLFSLMSACAAAEPRASVWIFASIGSACAALYGPPRKVWIGLGHWITGIFFAVSFVIVIDHVQPEAEAFLVGLASVAAVKVFVDSFGLWIGSAISRTTTGGDRRVP